MSFILWFLLSTNSQFQQGCHYNLYTNKMECPVNKKKTFGTTIKSVPIDPGCIPSPEGCY